MAAPVDYQAVRTALEDLLRASGAHDDGSIGPLMVRLAWHSCGTFSQATRTGGSQGARMRFKPESTDQANKGIDIARAALEPVKALFPRLSYGDLYTLAGAVAIAVMSDNKCIPPWKSGRVDLAEHELTEANVVLNGRLPDAAQGAEHIRSVFSKMGFGDRELVCLSGAHSLGRCHTDRSGYDGIWTRTPILLTNKYYVLLENLEWKPRQWKGPFQYESPDGALMMLPTDIALITDPKLKQIVSEYAADQDLFFRDFAKDFATLLELGVRDNVPLAKASKF